MGIINVLNKEVAQLIAAGEVVERPSSVIKELVENAIDAKATLITVEIKNGGVTYMRVSDNGCGIAPDDVPKMFLRYATSKVHSEEDLNNISTLGFRGEAMASIGAVCQVELLTRVPEEDEGVRYVADGGEDAELIAAGCPVGTTIIARNIFFNTPARMKFLKKDVSEANSVMAVVEKTALSHPEISFKLIRDGQIRLHSPGDGKLLSAIHAVFGKEFSAGIIPLDYTSGDVHVTGYITSPTASRSNRSLQNFFINGRFAKTRTAAAALEEAYKHSIMVGKFPACVLNLELPFSRIDVNVHPAKIEVRFVDEKSVFDSVYYGVKNALSQYELGLSLEERGSPQPTKFQPKLSLVDLQPQEKAVQSRLSTDSGTGYRPASSTLSTADQMTAQAYRLAFSPEPSTNLTLEDSGAYSSYTSAAKVQFQPPKGQNWTQEREEPLLAHKGVAVLTEEEIPAEKPLETGRLIGELFSTYILLQNGDNLVLVDKHAAHERLIFNKLKEKSLAEDRQLLLEPVVVHLSREDYQAAVNRLEAFGQIGFLVADFGEGDLLVREAPVVLPSADIQEVIEQIAHKISTHKRDLTPEAVDDLLHSVACKSAVRAGDKNSRPELWEIWELLQENEDVRYCPHGRPVAKTISRRDIEKMFGRI